MNLRLDTNGPNLNRLDLDRVDVDVTTDGGPADATPTAPDAGVGAADPQPTPRAPVNVAEQRLVAQGHRQVTTDFMRARLEANLPGGPDAAAPAPQPNPSRRAFTVGTPPPAAPEAGGADLVRQERDWSTASRNDLQTLQTELLARGHDPGAIDGVWGPNTSGALDAARADAGAPTDLIAADRDWSSAPSGDVRQLQAQLERAGHSPGELDGVWGPNTRAALESAQGDPNRAGPAAAGPTDTGPVTDAGPTDDGPVTDAGPAAADRGLIDADRDWSTASRDEVETLQTELLARGHDPGEIDGAWGGNTRRALEAARADDAEPTNLIEQDRDWSTADRGEVRQLQAQLERAGHSPGEIDGVWGGNTARALDEARGGDAGPVDPNRSVDPNAGADGDDEIDLDQLPSDLVLTGEDWSEAAPGRVRELQTALNASGIDVGEVDGVFDDETQQGLDTARWAIEHDINYRNIYRPQEEALPEVPETPVVRVGGPDGADGPNAPDGPDAVDGPQPEPGTPEAILSRAYGEDTPAEEVRELQTTLRDLGLDPGPVDGQWGRRTRAALTQAKAAGLDHGGREGSHDLSLAFDGNELHVRDAEGEIIRSFPARSGLPEGSPSIPGLNDKYGANLAMDVDYTSPDQQDVAFAGPVPEARYSLALSEDMDFDRTGAEDGAGWGVGGWGMEETLLNRLGGRNGFFIHHDGGNPGTAGCIGLESREDMLELQALLQRAAGSGQGSLDVRVDYAETSNSPFQYW